MDYGIVGSIFTVLVLVFFIGIVIWAFSKKSQKGFDEAANLVFDDEQDNKASAEYKRESSLK
ncbi:cbb3-type cytochrome c oxidase subunit 3 [Paraneptunicella aestuarii]|uniref:cbb3-type cytochrome oxidase subunit 3 n=1 Tax=Paraneptunicella aestuarii TaxID=2831148 RepID=UPI001E55417F|nr:cbb3-type cytochrome c oxidase subunit 3 [Paraneptunicella aestuarii]UAA40776.1 cbb3-type cytochrome c oxidase subunit 3 [Paraneptunicella aestuarii]